ncbi:hypothetical protein [Saccharopolyspora hattusasensis]|uniref:hypothetical protein n=1 Tax=Saccharopolyspora hattusasensis TaxID=1128679 RepID=UPI003D99583D
MTELVLYSERGSSWWPVLWGPVFALLGFGVEALTPGSVNAVAWLLVGGVLAAAAATWVYGRRRLVSVRLTPAELVQGRRRARGQPHRGGHRCRNARGGTSTRRELDDPEGNG